MGSVLETVISHQVIADLAFTVAELSIQYMP